MLEAILNMANLKFILLAVFLTVAAPLAAVADEAAGLKANSEKDFLVSLNKLPAAANKALELRLSEERQLREVAQNENPPKEQSRSDAEKNSRDRFNYMMRITASACQDPEAFKKQIDRGEWLPVVKRIDQSSMERYVDEAKKAAQLDPCQSSVLLRVGSNGSNKEDFRITQFSEAVEHHNAHKPAAPTGLTAIVDGSKK